MFSDKNHSKTYLLFSTIDGAPIFWNLICGRVLEKKSTLKTNNFCKERPNTQHYCIIFVFSQKLFKNIPLGWTMNSLVGPWQISFVTCHWSFQFFDAMTFLSIFSFSLDLSTWSLFFVSDALGFMCFLQGLLVPAFEKLEENEKKIQPSLA